MTDELASLFDEWRNLLPPVMHGLKDDVVAVAGRGDGANSHTGAPAP